MTKSELEKIMDEKAEAFVKEYAKETHPNFYYSPLNCFLRGFNCASELLMKEIESLQAKLKVACDALEFYGNEKSWDDRILRLGDNEPTKNHAACGGKRAREALAELRKTE